MAELATRTELVATDLHVMTTYNNQLLLWPSIPTSNLCDRHYQLVTLVTVSTNQLPSWPSISTSYLCDRPYQPTTFVTVNTNQLPLWPSIPTSYHCGRLYQPVTGTFVTVSTNQLPLRPSLPTSYLCEGMVEQILGSGPIPRVMHKTQTQKVLAWSKKQHSLFIQEYLHQNISDKQKTSHHKIFSSRAQ